MDAEKIRLGTKPLFLICQTIHGDFMRGKSGEEIARFIRLSLFRPTLCSFQSHFTKAEMEVILEVRLQSYPRLV